jgi:thiol-disulfide isomerase/thioredoxin
MLAETGKIQLQKWLRTIFIYTAIFVIASFAGNLWLTRNQAHNVAPHIEGIDLDGNELPINYQKYSKPLVLYFFADWCPVCKFQHPVIRTMGEEYPVIAIAMQSGNNQQLRQYLALHEISFPVINDRDGLISSAFGVQGVPAIFIIQQDARIAFSTRGYTSETGLLSRLWLSKIW